MISDNCFQSITINRFKLTVCNRALYNFETYCKPYSHAAAGLNCFYNYIITVLTVWASLYIESSVAPSTRGRNSRHCARRRRRRRCCCSGWKTIACIASPLHVHSCTSLSYQLQPGRSRTRQQRSTAARRGGRTRVRVELFCKFITNWNYPFNTPDRAVLGPTSRAKCERPSRDYARTARPPSARIWHDQRVCPACPAHTQTQVFVPKHMRAHGHMQACDRMRCNRFVLFVANLGLYQITLTVSL